MVGDIHGRLDLLEALLAQIVPDAPLVFVGDYIDRGEQSAQVLRRVQEMDQARARAICLIGNHEDMLLKFLDDPVGRGRRWLRFGGLQTLSSFGIGPVAETSPPQALEQAGEALAERMGAALIAWLRALPTSWQSGNVAVVHAGADPQLPLESQDPQALKWGHPAFRKTPRRDGIWVVHGHTIVDQPHAEAGRIAIDTGAFATGRLTAARIAPGELRFLST